MAAVRETLMIFDHEDVLLLLNRAFHNEINDKLTRKQLEEYLPGAICNEELNTSYQICAAG